MIARDIPGRIKSLRKVNTPLVAVETVDPKAAMAAIAKSFVNGDQPAFLHWSLVSGYTGENAAGQEVIREVFREMAAGMDMTPEQVAGGMTNVVEALKIAKQFPTRSLVFAETLAACWDEQGTSGIAAQQATLDLRDEFKADRRTLVVLAPTIKLPGLLKDTITLLTEPLPTVDDLRCICVKAYDGMQTGHPAEDMLDEMVDALVGLPAFPAEQTVSECLRSAVDAGEELDPRDLFGASTQVINQTSGLTVGGAKVTFIDVGGNAAIKEYLALVGAGKFRPRVVLHIDEIEKSLGGFGGGGPGDNTGTTQDQVGQLLQWMEDSGVTGLLLVGPPGCSKTLLADATAGELGVRKVRMDLGAMKGSLLGQSEAAIRDALRVISAIGQDKVLVIATCNKLDALPPEFKRRFKLGIWYCDLPSDEEREEIWRIQRDKYDIPVSYARPSVPDLVGADIRNICEIADGLGIDLAKASKYIVPVAKAAAATITSLRNLADGNFLSTSYEGPYRRETPAGAEKAIGNRDGLRSLQVKGD